ncbi:hypothetical protein FF125_10150 [Aureibaculum algae]|uniref:Lipoprotein n=1 Tax=Aureibaculum algae TaxID=2584122 RepID=A0A5B7TRA8_9FLAO|nr:hypothetical protein [Aureibaculum algae]QCX38778.1 hypothetical protein FF125_10150 [Aureibaculum algae]
MKKFTFILLSILTIGCANEVDIDGYWQGHFTFPKERVPALIKFENGKFIDFFGVYNDTVEYKRNDDKILFGNATTRSGVFKIKVNKNELTTFKNETDSIFVSLKKKQAERFIFDYLNDKNLKLELPDGHGIKRNIGPKYFRNPLYLSYIDSNLVANFLDTTVHVNSKYHILLRKLSDYSNHYENSLHINKVTLIIDKNLKMSDVNLISNQLRLAGYLKVYYYLKSDSYEKINFLSTKLRPISEIDYHKYNSEENQLSPPPPSFLLDYFKGEILRLYIDKNKVTLNDTIININKLNEFMKLKLLPNKELGVFYQISESSTYQDFIRFNDVIYNAYYDIRNVYLLQKYNISYRDNFDYDKDEIIESKKTFPMFLKQIDSIEYEKVKKFQKL